jgi:hypothetical protein
VSEGGSITVPSVVLYQLWYGLERGENTERLRVFLPGDSEIVPFDDEDAAAGEQRWSRRERRLAPTTY